MINSEIKEFLWLIERTVFAFCEMVIWSIGVGVPIAYFFFGRL